MVYPRFLKYVLLLFLFYYFFLFYFFFLILLFFIAFCFLHTIAYFPLVRNSIRSTNILVYSTHSRLYHGHLWYFHNTCTAFQTIVLTDCHFHNIVRLFLFQELSSSYLLFITFYSLLFTTFYQLLSIG